MIFLMGGEKEAARDMAEEGRKRAFIADASATTILVLTYFLACHNITHRGRHQDIH